MLNPRTSLHEQLLDTMRSLNARLHRHFGDELKTRGASVARLKLLSFIQRAGSVRSADVVEAFRYAPRTVTEALDALERDGLVRRAPDPLDRRAKRITLTPAGLSVLEEAAPHLRAIMERIFDTVDVEEEAELLRLLQLLDARLIALEEKAGASTDPSAQAGTR